MVDLSPNWSNVSVNDAKSIDKWQHTQTPSNYGGATSVPFVHLEVMCSTRDSFTPASVMLRKGYRLSLHALRRGRTDSRTGRSA